MLAGETLAWTEIEYTTVGILISSVFYGLTTAQVYTYYS